METGQDCMAGADFVVGILDQGTVNGYTRPRGLGNGQPTLTANQVLTGTSIATDGDGSLVMISFFFFIN